MANNKGFDVLRCVTLLLRGYYVNDFFAEALFFQLFLYEQNSNHNQNNFKIFHVHSFRMLTIEAIINHNIKLILNHTIESSSSTHAPDIIYDFNSVNNVGQYVKILSHNTINA